MIDIEDEETIALIMEFAALRGVDPDTAVRLAVRAALQETDSATGTDGNDATP